MESKTYFPFCFLHTSLRVDFEKIVSRSFNSN